MKGLPRTPHLRPFVHKPKWVLYDYRERTGKKGMEYDSVSIYKCAICGRMIARS